MRYILIMLLCFGLIGCSTNKDKMWEMEINQFTVMKLWKNPFWIKETWSKYFVIVRVDKKTYQKASDEKINIIFSINKEKEGDLKATSSNSQ